MKSKSKTTTVKGDKIVKDEKGDNSGVKSSVQRELKLTNKENDDSHSSTSSTSSNSFRGKPSACVFVASLNSNLSDDELSLSVTDHFTQWGKLSTVKVLRDTSNRPYAFVQYTNDRDCKTAIEQGHHSMLAQRTIRCEAAKVNRTLFVQTNDIVTEIQIRSELQEFGEIEQLTISSKTGSTQIDDKLSQFWYCKFSFRDDAIKAFASLAEQNKYQVDWAQNIDTKSKDKVELNETKFDKFSVFINQLNPNIDETQLRARFERHGKIENVHIVNKEKFSFAFIKYETESGAAGAVERENHSLFDGKSIHIQYREFQNNTKVSTNPFGVPLAPPPINLNRNIKYLKPSQVPGFGGSSTKFNRGDKFLERKPYHDRSIGRGGFFKRDYKSTDRNYYSKESTRGGGAGGFGGNSGRPRQTSGRGRFDRNNDNYSNKNNDSGKFYYIPAGQGNSNYSQQYFVNGDK